MGETVPIAANVFSAEKVRALLIPHLEADQVALIVLPVWQGRSSSARDLNESSAPQSGILRRCQPVQPDDEPGSRATHMGHAGLPDLSAGGDEAHLVQHLDATGHVTQ